jgi:hypothetical protein
VLSQLGIFREYVEPLEPSVVIWFVSVGYADAAQESNQPFLARYLESAFSQNLRDRQGDVDSFIREVFVPVIMQQDEALHTEIARAKRLPLGRVIKFREVRDVIDIGSQTGGPPPTPDLSHFERAMDLIADSAREWGGHLLVVVLPSHGISTGDPYNVVQYKAVLDALGTSDVSIIDGAAVFNAEPDRLGLYALRADNHPSERGHAVLADAVIAVLQREGVL